MIGAATAELRVESATGVAVRLDLVGPGGRCLAFLCDWVLRATLAAAWFAAAAWTHNFANGREGLAAPPQPGTGWFLGVLLPAAALYFLYHPLLELLLRGRTPGKRYAGMRLVTRSGATPGAGALLLRNLFRLIDALPLFYGVGLVTTLVTREHLRIGDLAAGTLLVYERAPRLVTGGASAASAALDPEQVALASDLLERWSTLDEGLRATLADRLLEATGRTPGPAANDAARLAALRALGGGTAP